MFKKVAILAVMALALPLAAFASTSSGVDFANIGGTLAGSNAGLSLTSSPVVTVNGLNGMGLVQGSSLGAISFTTGALISGSLASGNATFAGGGMVTITGNGINGVPMGTIFSGTFQGPVTWTKEQGTPYFELNGTVTGTFSANGSGSGFTTTGRIFERTTGAGTIVSGDTSISVPEPGTLSLFGTGLLGLAGLVRRKLSTK